MAQLGKAWLAVPAAVALALLISPPARASYVPAQGGGYAQIYELARQIERRAQMPGFAAFALGVATRESRGNNLAINDSASEAKHACDLYLANADTRYADNPYGAARFCFGSGGWYGLMPATALAGKPFRTLDPYLIFDPAASTVLLADYVRRVVKGYFHKLPASCRNYLTIRRFMASNKVGLDCDETNYDRSAVVRERFGADLAERGIAPTAMFKPVVIGAWPGGTTLMSEVTGAEGAVAPVVLEDTLPEALR